MDNRRSSPERQNEKSSPASILAQTKERRDFDEVCTSFRKCNLCGNGTAYTDFFSGEEDEGFHSEEAGGSRLLAASAYFDLMKL